MSERDSVSIMFDAIKAYLVDRDNFTRGLLDLGELLEKVPESRLCNNMIWSKKAHSEELWSRFLFSRKSTSNDLVFVQSGLRILEKKNMRMDIVFMS